MNIPSNIVGISVEGSNMYGCQPCPKCRSVYRVAWKRGDSHRIECDDCGHHEPAVMVDGDDETCFCSGGFVCTACKIRKGDV